MANKAQPFSFTRSINDSLAQARAEVKRLNNVKAHAAQFGMAMAACNAVAKVARDNGAFEWAYITPRVYSENDMSLHCKFECQTESLKVGKVPAVINAAINAGFEPTNSSDHASEAFASRTFRFHQVLNGVDVTLAFEANIVSSEAATCRKVQTGTKIEEVATYEIVCD